MFNGRVIYKSAYFIHGRRVTRREYLRNKNNIHRTSEPHQLEIYTKPHRGFR